MSSQHLTVDTPVEMAPDTYRALFASFDAGFCIVEVVADLSNKVTDVIVREVNNAYERHTGLVNLTGRRISEVLPNLEPYWLDYYTTVFNTGIPVREENYLQDVDRWFNTHYSLIGPLGSRLVAVVFEETTAKKRAEKVLAESESRQAFLLKFSDAIRAEKDELAISAVAVALVTDQFMLDRCYVTNMDLARDRAEMIYQYAGPGLDDVPGVVDLSAFPRTVGASLHSTLVYDDIANDPRLSELDRDSFAEMQYGALLAVPLRKGQQLPVWCFAAATVGRRHWTPGEIALLEDVAERTWAAIERAKVESTLRESEQQLKVLLKLQEDFMGVASHELKTPVTVIKAYAQLAMEEFREAGFTKDAELMEIISKQVNRLTGLINDLLDTTKISEGKLNFHFEAFDLHALLKERTMDMQRTTKLPITLDLRGDGVVYGDSERIGQVIVNLLSNAIKFSPNGGRILVCSTQTGDSIRVSVKDEGVGISRPDQAQLFQRFYRGTKDNRDTYPGMGLGLYISAQIVRRHNGTLAVQSEEGEGAVFSFTLSAAQEAARPPGH